MGVKIGIKRGYSSSLRIWRLRYKQRDLVDEYLSPICYTCSCELSAFKLQC